ncbi:hypothetical protein BKA70DRAFT_1241270 [Coprinopsis sp. MPI-PUGE-AT-0042]|nr:hypothetical protein BKA70DRAFT_1241260 [Coprinopsis sp. MPI-PUGE-AT-0042]KAH6872119.1 hypothetical protein BKA70DRAFT_1241270 [Coprinopsis sp. MPI-PUGE-AT-0042]
MATTGDGREFTLDFLLEVSADLADPRAHIRPPPQQSVPQASVNSASSRFTDSATPDSSSAFPSLQVHGPSEDGHSAQHSSFPDDLYTDHLNQQRQGSPGFLMLTLSFSQSQHQPTAQSSAAHPSCQVKHLLVDSDLCLPLGSVDNSGWYGNQGDGQLVPQPVYPHQGTQVNQARQLGSSLPAAAASSASVVSQVSATAAATRKSRKIFEDIRGKFRKVMSLNSNQRQTPEASGQTPATPSVEYEPRLSPGFESCLLTSSSDPFGSATPTFFAHGSSASGFGASSSQLHSSSPQFHSSSSQPQALSSQPQASYPTSETEPSGSQPPSGYPTQCPVMANGVHVYTLLDSNEISLPSSLGCMACEDRRMFTLEHHNVLHLLQAILYYGWPYN